LKYIPKDQKLSSAEARRDYQRKYYQMHKEKAKEYQRIYNLTHQKKKDTKSKNPPKEAEREEKTTSCNYYKFMNLPIEKTIKMLEKIINEEITFKI